MTAQEIYNLPPIRVETEYLESFIEHHVYESPVFPDLTGNTRIDKRVYYYLNIDHRRYVELASIWFDGKPVMITQNAGREGDDHKERFITDLPLYMELLKYLMEIHANSLTDQSVFGGVLDKDADTASLTTFYGDILSLDKP